MSVRVADVTEGSSSRTWSIAWAWMTTLGMLFSAGVPAQPAPEYPTTNKNGVESYEFSSFEQRRFRVVVVARGLYRPFAVAILPSGDALVSERNVSLRLVHNATGATAWRTYLDPKPIAGITPQLPRKYAGAGLQDITLHPEFARNGWIYFTYITPGPNDQAGDLTGRGIALMRGRFDGRALQDVETLYEGKPGGAYGARVAVAPDGKTVFVSTAAEDSVTTDAEAEQAQSLTSVNGKVLRLNADGSIPDDNPCLSVSGARPEIYSIGHRDPQGLALVPGSGVLLSVEHGPNGGDEMNVIQPGRNYGWPLVTFGRHYDGRKYSEFPVAAGVEPPILVWLPSIAPSGLAFYSGNRFPAWKGNVFTASARRGEVPRTGGLERIVFNDRLEEVRRETLLTELHLRIRDVREDPDGLLYVLSDEDDGALMRFEPAP